MVICHINKYFTQVCIYILLHKLYPLINLAVSTLPQNKSTEPVNYGHSIKNTIEEPVSFFLNIKMGGFLDSVWRFGLAKEIRLSANRCLIKLPINPGFTLFQIRFPLVPWNERLATVGRDRGIADRCAIRAHLISWWKNFHGCFLEGDLYFYNIRKAILWIIEEDIIHSLRILLMKLPLMCCISSETCSLGTALRKIT